MIVADADALPLIINVMTMVDKEKSQKNNLIEKS